MRACPPPRLPPPPSPALIYISPPTYTLTAATRRRERTVRAFSWTVPGGIGKRAAWRNRLRWSFSTRCRSYTSRPVLLPLLPLLENNPCVIQVPAFANGSILPCGSSAWSFLHRARSMPISWRVSLDRRAFLSCLCFHGLFLCAE